MHDTIAKRARLCAHCERPYINPCDARRKEACPNFLYRQHQPKRATKETKRGKAGKR